VLYAVIESGTRTVLYAVIQSGTRAVLYAVIQSGTRAVLYAVIQSGTRDMHHQNLGSVSLNVILNYRLLLFISFTMQNSENYLYISVTKEEDNLVLRKENHTCIHTCI